MGRVCPHPCESSCNRSGKDGAVAVNALERYLGDWALRRRRPLPIIDTEPKAESIGVIGSGPAGLSFAYQMARRGYSVTVYEKSLHAGGMLRYGIPDFRLPSHVLDGEIDRIADMGVQFVFDMPVGSGISIEEMRSRHEVLFVGIGAQAGRALGIPGEVGPGVWNGTAFLARVNSLKKDRDLDTADVRSAISIGPRTAVIGGGNTAIDAARTAARLGSEVTIFYRRTRAEMPAIEMEVQEAEADGVALELLATPFRIERADGRVQAIWLQRMQLGPPDESGRPRPVEVPGDTFRVEVDSIITAVSQTPEWSQLSSLRPDGPWADVGDNGAECEGPAVWYGGDATGLGIASTAIAHGRRAAESAHARLQGLPPPPATEAPPLSDQQIRYDHYPDAPRLREVDASTNGSGERRKVSKAEFLHEVERCLSCGSCMGCGKCFMYCNAGCYSKLEITGPGEYFELSLDACEGCGKCVELCPCVFVSSAGITVLS